MTMLRSDLDICVEYERKNVLWPACCSPAAPHGWTVQMFAVPEKFGCADFTAHQTNSQTAFGSLNDTGLVFLRLITTFHA